MTQRATTNSRYIISPSVDWFLLITIPATGIVVAFLTSFLGAAFEMYDEMIYYVNVITAGIVAMHLSMVFFRSHGNPIIFKRFPYRFTLVPLLIAAFAASSQITLALTVLVVTWWGMYHTAAQTFGLCRIYDMKLKNPPTVGRKLDLWMNIYIYSAPVIATASTLSVMLKNLENFSDTPLEDSMIELGKTIFNHHSEIAATIALIGAIYIPIYLFAYWRLHKQGYVVSFQKICLMLCTAAASLYAWHFETLGQAYLLFEGYHAIQYIAIMWFYEKDAMRRCFGLKKIDNNYRLTAIFLGIFGIACGVIFFFGHKSTGFLFIFVLMIELLHYWYDGFIWSVRRKDV